VAVLVGGTERGKRSAYRGRPPCRARRPGRRPGRATRSRTRRVRCSTRANENYAMRTYSRPASAS
jgi:hypothetical protein